MASGRRGEAEATWIDEGELRADGSRHLSQVESVRRRRVFHRGVRLANGEVVRRFDVVALAVPTDGGRAPSSPNELARVVALWQDTADENAGEMLFLGRWLFLPKHLPKHLSKQMRGRRASREVFEQCNYVGDINSVNTVHNKVNVVCRWNNSKNLIPSDDFIDLAEYWLNRMWDTRSENFRSMDDVVDSDKSDCVSITAEEVCNHVCEEHQHDSAETANDEDDSDETNPRAQLESSPQHLAFPSSLSDEDDPQSGVPRESSRARKQHESKQDNQRPEQPRRKQWDAEASRLQQQAYERAHHNVGFEQARGRVRELDVKEKDGADQTHCSKQRKTNEKHMPWYGENHRAREKRQDSEGFGQKGHQWQNEDGTREARQEQQREHQQERGKEQAGTTQGNGNNSPILIRKSTKKPKPRAPPPSEAQSERLAGAKVAVAVWNIPPKAQNHEALWAAVSNVVEHAMAVSEGALASNAWIWFADERAAKEAIPKLKELCWPCDQINAYVPLVVEPIQYLHGSPYGGVVARDLPNAIVSMANGGRGQRQIIPRFAQSGTVQHDVAKRWRAQSLRQGEELRDLKELQRDELMNFLSQHKLTRE